MVCEKCNAEHDGSYGSGRFCSLGCARSHKHTDESKANISLAIRKSITDETRKRISEGAKAWHAANKKEPIKPIPGNCENCGKEHDGSYASGRFCNKQCSSSFCTKAKRQEINEKVSITLKKTGEFYCDVCSCLFNTKAKLRAHEIIHRPDYEKIKELRKLKWLLSEYSQTREKRRKLKLETTPFEDLRWQTQKDVLFAERGNKCSSCGFEYSDERGKGPFAVHHINGDVTCNTRENLAILCLNCHWITPNFGMKNRKHSAATISNISRALKSKQLVGDKNCECLSDWD